MNYNIKNSIIDHHIRSNLYLVKNVRNKKSSIGKIMYINNKNFIVKEFKKYNSNLLYYKLFEYLYNSQYKNTKNIPQYVIKEYNFLKIDINRKKKLKNILIIYIKDFINNYDENIINDILLINDNIFKNRFGKLYNLPLYVNYPTIFTDDIKNMYYICAPNIHDIQNYYFEDVMVIYNYNIECKCVSFLKLLIDNEKYRKKYHKIYINIVYSLYHRHINQNSYINTEYNININNMYLDISLFTNNHEILYNNINHIFFKEYIDMYDKNILEKYLLDFYIFEDLSIVSIYNIYLEAKKSSII